MDEASREDVAAGRVLWQEALRPGEPAGAALRGMRVAALEGSGDCRTLFVHAGGWQHSTRVLTVLHLHGMPGVPGNDDWHATGASLAPIRTLLHSAGWQMTAADIQRSAPLQA